MPKLTPDTDKSIHNFDEMKRDAGEMTLDFDEITRHLVKIRLHVDEMTLHLVEIRRYFVNMMRNIDEIRRDIDEMKRHISDLKRSFELENSISARKKMRQGKQRRAFCDKMSFFNLSLIKKNEQNTPENESLSINIAENL